MLSYSAVVWVGALDKQVNSTKLERVQALALRITCGTLPGTSHESLNHVTNTPGITTYLPKRGSQRGSTPTSQRGMDYRKAPNNHLSCCNQQQIHRITPTPHRQARPHQTHTQTHEQLLPRVPKPWGRKRTQEHHSNMDKQPPTKHNHLLHRRLEDGIWNRFWVHYHNQQQPRQTHLRQR